MAFIAVQRASTFVSRSAARPFVRVAFAACAAAAAWIRRRKAAIVIGSDGNRAAANTMAGSMMPARARTPGTLSLLVPRDGFGLIGLLMMRSFRSATVGRLVSPETSGRAL